MSENEEIKLARLEERVNRMEHALFDNGQKGIISKVTEFMAAHWARESERHQEEVRRDKKYTLFLSIITAIVLAVGSVVTMLEYISARHLGVISNIPQIYTSHIERTK